jgi:hypothetical protein
MTGNVYRPNKWVQKKHTDEGISTFSHALVPLVIGGEYVEVSTYIISDT